MKSEYELFNDVQMDFSPYTVQELTEKEKRAMKKTWKKENHSKKKYIVLAACVASVTVLTVSAYATGLLERIISTGFNEFVWTAPSDAEYPIPENLKGMFFDENGDALTTVHKDTVYYDKDGNKLEGTVYYTAEDGSSYEISFHGGKEAEELSDPLAHAKEEGYPIITDEAQIADYLCFTPQLPTTIPDGYTFYGASAYGDEYLFVYYMNDRGEYIQVHERIINEETAFSTGTDGTIEETTINGCKAVIMDNASIYWETDGVSVGVSGQNTLPIDELTKLAESMQPVKE